MKADDLLDMIGDADDSLVEEAGKRKKTKRPEWIRWAAAAACLCLAAGAVIHFAGAPGRGGNRVMPWASSYTAADYFRNSGEGESGAEEKSIADRAVPYAESRDFSGSRSLMEEEGAIPAMESHPLFYAQANYSADGSIYSVEMTWNRRDLKGLEHYSDLSLTAGYEEIPAVEDCIVVELGPDGKVLEPAATVTERDGVQIIARGREDQKKTITFQNPGGWYQISGSWNDSYEDVAALFEWFWDHPLDFSRFAREDGDIYSFTTLEEMPDAFSGSLPDFAAFGYACDYTAVTLKNGEPVAFYGVYLSGVTEEQAANGDYTPGENGAEQIDWGLKREPDYYEREWCIGDVESVSEEEILGLLPPDSITTQTKIQLRQGDGVLIIYATDLRAAWELIESVR